MVLAWDFPVVQFGEGRKWHRRYTDFYGTSGENAWKIARDGLLHATEWSEAIDRWQAPYINDESKPLWYRGMLFNELYAITDGGTFWGREAGSDPKAAATFALLECFDYAYYGTLDVRFYASLPLLKFWPEIDKQVLREFAATVQKEWPEQGLGSGSRSRPASPLRTSAKRSARCRTTWACRRAIRSSPSTSPAGRIRTTGRISTRSSCSWSIATMCSPEGRTKRFLRECWPAMRAAIEYLRQFDHGGGVPENSGYPDQTYDDWVVSGVSAYSGGLWLAALRAGEETARIVGDAKTASEYHALFLKGQKTYVTQLWNGEYFRYDTSSESKDDIQTDQLAGQWYANLTGLGDIVPHAMELSALKKIFDFNVMKFGDGQMGAANGMTADGKILTNAEAKEVWVGTTAGYAGLLMSEGMQDEAWKSAWGLYHVIYESKGYWFRTPEAWDVTGNFRAGMYMRPMAIWALEMTPRTREIDALRKIMRIAGMALSRRAIFWMGSVAWFHAAGARAATPGDRRSALQGSGYCGGGRDSCAVRGSREGMAESAGGEEPICSRLHSEHR